MQACDHARRAITFICAKMSSKNILRSTSNTNSYQYTFADHKRYCYKYNNRTLVLRELLYLLNLCTTAIPRNNG